jgi:hypothetical protein
MGPDNSLCRRSSDLRRGWGEAGALLPCEMLRMRTWDGSHGTGRGAGRWGGIKPDFDGELWDGSG